MSSAPVLGLASERPVGDTHTSPWLSLQQFACSLGLIPALVWFCRLQCMYIHYCMLYIMTWTYTSAPDPGWLLGNCLLSPLPSSTQRDKAVFALKRLSHVMLHRRSRHVELSCCPCLIKMQQTLNIDSVIQVRWGLHKITREFIQTVGCIFVVVVIRHWKASSVPN